MKNVIKNITVLFVVIMSCVAVCSCTAHQEPQEDSPAQSITNQSVPEKKLIKIPDIEKLDVGTAKALLAGKGLIPKVEYEYNNDYDYDLVIRTAPAIGSEVEEDTPVTLYVCKGPSYYELSDTVGYMMNVEGIDDFIWWSDAEDGWGTKGFTNVWVEKGYLYIEMYLGCKSEYSIEFYGDFGTASINDTFDKTVPIKVIYDSKKVANDGSITYFKVKIPLSDLGVQKPTNIYVEFDFLVGGEREVFEAGFDLSW